LNGWNDFTGLGVARPRNTLSSGLTHKDFCPT
jgi:hypothetical protein